MITLFVALSFLTSAKPSNIKELQVQKVKHGENVSIKCDDLSMDKNKLVWFKQSFGKVPQSVGRGGESSFRPGEGFNDGRFSISVNKKLLNLNIKEIKEEDTGAYFCAELLVSSLHFRSGTLLVVEAEEKKQYPPTVTVMENGESLTLQCSVQAFTSSCEEQSVYWFRHGSGESHPGIIYTHGDGSDECKKSSEAGSPTQSCVYTLPKRKLTTSDNGTIYCAVAACGQILFGNGIKVELKSKQDSTDQMYVLFWLSVCRVGVLAFTLIIFTIIICKLRTMITLFVALSFLTSVKPSNIKELQVQKVKLGQNVTIICDDLSSDKNNLVWFKQIFGKAPQWVGRGGESSFRAGEGFNDGRFSISVNKNLLHLNIKEIKEEDTGTYFCAELLASSLHFGSGTLLVVEAEEMKRHPPTVTAMENGESLTLQCSVQAFNSSCEEQSVYWFRHSSGESHPSIIYTHGDGSDECKKSSEAGSPTQSCVYTLPKRKLTTSDNEMFYCAVAACGQILFGNGIKVEGIQLKDNKLWIVLVLTTSNIMSVIVIMVLVGVLLKKQRKGASDDHPNNTNQADDEDVLNYAAVSFAKKPSSSRTSRGKNHEDVYAQVKIN
ncbi:uncharacterized protein LOC113524709 [Pangasianodon hypophthalmus]|uniref:uncharacterized protein LOC113524709 n=1 Tax=Pangasianodon hypophthalmus TaxID=310915 RepID=UPI002307685F|nr:uncharacterized protein LOC113524709 [Pangasianodon hypophthalmus]